MENYLLIRQDGRFFRYIPMNKNHLVYSHLPFYRSRTWQSLWQYSP